ncbi:MAG: hypothetical protein HFH32_09065 [Eubacterium sp.]|jgi:hypothetical protein|nr:hypothetical protein [Eubacterium sp.]
MEDIAQLLLSQQAVLIYEIVIAVILVISIVLISRQRRLRKQIQESAQQRQVKRSLDDSLANQRRR